MICAVDEIVTARPVELTVNAAAPPRLSYVKCGDWVVECDTPFARFKRCKIFLRIVPANPIEAVWLKARRERNVMGLQIHTAQRDLDQAKRGACVGLYHPSLTVIRGGNL